MKMLDFDPTQRITLDEALKHVFFTADEESMMTDSLTSKRMSVCLGAVCTRSDLYRRFMVPKGDTLYLLIYTSVK